MISAWLKLGLTTKDFKGLIPWLPLTGALALFLFCFATIPNTL
jgi:hypothetical protein